MASRIQIAKPDIIKTFEQMPRVMRIADVAKAFDENRDFWRLAQSTSVRSFTAFLLEKTLLRRVSFKFPQREVSGYTWGDVPLLETLQGLIDGSYYSHYTAVRVHGLTEQVPKTIYVTQEKSEFSSHHSQPGPFEQAAIDAAFKRPPRASKNEVVVGDVRVMLLSSAYHSGRGITTETLNLGEAQSLVLRVTNLERTLIDIVVRPFYAGGVFEVAKAFENAKGKLSVNRLNAMLKEMAFGYPYHQAVGFYLERAGYKASLVEIFKKIPMERDFYLTHAMGKMIYVERWRLYVPEGF